MHLVTELNSNYFAENTIGGDEPLNTMLAIARLNGGVIAGEIPESQNPILLEEIKAVIDEENLAEAKSRLGKLLQGGCPIN
jgi:hypothetical protein